MKRFRAFTMIELLLYIGMVSIFIVALAIFLGYFNQAKIKSTTIEEVNQQGLLISEYINKLIRDSNSITSPAKGGSASSLTLSSTKYPTRSPIVVALNANKITVSEAGAASIQLSSDRLSVTSLTFNNYSQASTNGNISYAFTLTYINPSGKSEFNYTQTFYGSATTR